MARQRVAGVVIVVSARWPGSWGIGEELAESQLLGGSEQSFVDLRRVARDESPCGFALEVLEARQWERSGWVEAQEPHD